MKNNNNSTSFLTLLVTIQLAFFCGCNGDRAIGEFENALNENDSRGSLAEPPVTDSKPIALPMNEVLKRKKELEHIALTNKIELGKASPFWGIRCLSYKVNIPVFNPVLAEWETIQATYVTPRSRYIGSEGTLGFVISPNISGTSPLEVRFAALLCQNNMASIYPSRSVDYSVEPEVYPGWSVFNENMKRNISRMKTLADFLQQQPEVSHIGAAGGSLGGIMTALFAGVDERVEASIIIAGGGDLAKILTESNVGILKKIRAKQMTFLDDPTPENYEQKLRSTLRYDPLAFANLALSDSLFMGIVEGDESVSTANQWLLWEAFGRPRYDSRTGPHVWGITKYVLHTHLQEAIEFVTRKTGK